MLNRKQNINKEVFVYGEKVMVNIDEHNDRYLAMKDFDEHDREVIDEIVKRVVEKVNPLKVILFGSYAYGSPTKDSDIDLLVIKESSVPRHRRSKEIRCILRGMKVAVDIIVYTPEEVKEWEGIDTAFITGVLRKGKVLYG